MLKLHQIFFRTFVTIFTIAIILSSIVSFYAIKSIKSGEIKEQLKNNINIFDSTLKSFDDIDKTVKNIHNETNIRVTIISKDGKVIAESSTDKDIMDNHLHRIEIEEANNNEFGSSIRFSHTLNEDFLYVAKKIIQDGNYYYIRMSYSIDKVFDNFNNLWLVLSLIFTLSILLALFVAYRINQSIQKEVDGIKTFLENLDLKNYDTRLETTFSKEFVTISFLIKKLALRLEKKAKQKRKQTAKLKLLNKQKDDIISSISHEFKNPIAVIVGYCETLQNDKNINDKIRDRFLDKISINANKMSQMINRLRLTINLENKDFKVNLSNTNIYNSVNDTIKLLSENYKDREIILNGKDTIIKADAVLIDIVITNLIENALKYSEDVIEIDVNDEFLAVKDYGCGIAVDDIDKVTDKFYRVDTNIWNNSLGIGLSIVNKIIKLHNFEFIINSKLNEGSTFIVKFK